MLTNESGVDDVMAMLLAMSASPEELEVLLISVTYGNVPLHSCLRNVVALFHVLDKEMQWRKSAGKHAFGALTAYKPLVAVGAEHPLEDEILMADHFRKSAGCH
jgi:inosine-uridine nucleoside N-ribohydrolase